MHHFFHRWAFIMWTALIAPSIFCVRQATAEVYQWTWMKGSDTGGHLGVYGVPGVPDAANTPGARNKAVSWMDSTGSLWLFGGNGFGMSTGSGWLNDLWKFDTTTENWTWIKGANTVDQFGTYGDPGVAAAANTPGARDGAVSWIDSTGSLWVFGGYGYAESSSEGYLNDLWRFDTTTGNWTWIKGSKTKGQSGTYGVPGAADAANTPGARYGGVSWTDSAGTLWLFGGIGFGASFSSGYLNDLWKFDTTAGNWTWMKGSNAPDQKGDYGSQGTPAASNTPGGRGHAVAWTGSTDALWLFAGYGYGASSSPRKDLNDLWRFDTTTGNWTWVKGSSADDQSGVYGFQGVPDDANRPGARSYAESWTDGTGSLWFFGGYGPAGSSSGDYNDLWKFDTATGNWTWMKGPNTIDQAGVYGVPGIPAAANMPGPREHPASWTDSTGSLWLFGGYGDSSYQNDLWRFSLPASNNAARNWQLFN